MLAWDRCAGDRQGLGRMQVNPNHVMYELAGAPIFGDGIPESGSEAFFVGATAEEIAAPLTPAERELIVAQYGSVEKWARAVQPGLIGAANTVILDHEYGYFPPGTRIGQLAYEQRDAELHLVTAESAEYYNPRYGLTRARRMIATSASGLSWIVDDYRAAQEHIFTWQAYLRRGCRRHENGLTLSVDGPTLSVAWLPGGSAGLELVPDFPTRGAGVEGRCWPQTGSERLRLETRGTTATFVVCLLPGSAGVSPASGGTGVSPVSAGGLTVRQVGEREWLAEWPGGSESFRLPEGADQPITPLPYPPEGVCDLEEAPFDLPEEPTEVLLAALESPAPEDWRATVRAMQALTERGVEAALPAIQRLLRDPGQRYQVTSVAAWCLGRARYAPAREDLRFMCSAPETNTNVRAACAVEALEPTGK